jgi:hypothetical protein
MYDIICEPIELSDQELDNVAGGNPFSANSVFGTAFTINTNFAIGAVQGDGSTLAALLVSASHA